jgi:flavin reductase (DIM6/NTAB) family NADH-FMN oxidoreductase RutF
MTRAGRLIAVDGSGTFEVLVGELEYSMFIVTVAAGEQLAGCLVGFSCQTSIHPPRFLVCLSRENHTYRVAMSAPELAVHFVPRRAEALVELFGGRTGDSVDKFSRCAWQSGPAGVPILQECPNWFVGRVLDRIDLGDHVGFLLEPIAAQRAGDPSYYPFRQAKHVEPGNPA